MPWPARRYLRAAGRRCRPRRYALADAFARGRRGKIKFSWCLLRRRATEYSAIGLASLLVNYFPLISLTHASIAKVDDARASGMRSASRSLLERHVSTGRRRYIEIIFAIPFFVQPLPGLNGSAMKRAQPYNYLPCFIIIELFSPHIIASRRLI